MFVHESELDGASDGGGRGGGGHDQAPEATGGEPVAARAQTRWSRVMKATSRLWRR